MAVEDILKNTAIPFTKVEYGEIHLQKDLTTKQHEVLNKKLIAIGFELIDSRMTGLIEKIKKYTILKARNESGEQANRLNLSVYLSEKLNFEYTYLSSIFSAVEGRTIEKFFIEQRIEKVKELIVYGQLSLLEIAYQLDYSSAAHLSSQFKKTTGLTPSHFKELGNSKRKSLDLI